MEGSPALFGSLSAQLERAGVHVAPLRGLGSLAGLLRRIDLRNHRKLAVIDGAVAYAGSQNLAAAPRRFRGEPQRELMVRVCGPAVAELQTVFAEDWWGETDRVLEAAVFTPPQPAGPARVQTLWWGPSDPRGVYGPLLVTALHAARERVVLTSPYFIPDERLQGALESTARRGVQVDLIVPERSDKTWVDAASRHHFEALLAAGVRVHLHGSGFLHTKAVSIDAELAIVGSANLDRRSFALDYELALIVENAAFARSVCAVQGDDLRESTPLRLERWRQRPAWRASLDALANLASPLL